MALETFEGYHQAIYQMEIIRRLKACGALDGSDYREQYKACDATRTRNHDALLSQVSVLNKKAEEEQAGKEKDIAKLTVYEAV